MTEVPMPMLSVAYSSLARSKEDLRQRRNELAVAPPEAREALQDSIRSWEQAIDYLTTQIMEAERARKTTS
jgi:hypothetical protein